MSTNQDPSASPVSYYLNHDQTSDMYIAIWKEYNYN